MYLSHCLACLGACQGHSTDGIHGVDPAGGDLGARHTLDAVCSLHDERLEGLPAALHRGVCVNLKAVVDVPACINPAWAIEFQLHHLLTIF